MCVCACRCHVPFSAKSRRRDGIASNHRESGISGLGPTADARHAAAQETLEEATQGEKALTVE